MTRNVSAVIDRVMANEGGIATLNDGAGETRFGQTKNWLDDNGFVPPMTTEQAISNYEQWLVKTRLADVCDRDVTLGYLLTDYAVNSGLHRAVSTLQALLRLPSDGVIGPKTLGAIAVSDYASLSRRLLAERLRFVGKLIRDNPPVRQFAAGWLNRLASQIEGLL